MNIHDLYKKIVALDQPVNEAKLDECPGDPMMGGMSSSTPIAPPSMSVNLNAQGMENIEDLLKLVTKVNPDMAAPHAAEPLTSEPHAAEIGGDEPEGPGMSMLAPPMSDIIGSIDRIEAEPENDGKDIDGVDLTGGHAEPDADNMGGPSDHDADNEPHAEPDADNMGGPSDHDADNAGEEEGGEEEGGEEEGDDEQEEAYGNSPNGVEGDPFTQDTNFMTNTLAGGMNKPHYQAKHSYRTSDNPMAMPEGDLRAQIRAELAQRLEEAKTKSYSAKDAAAGKDIGKPGKNFAKIAKKSGGGEKGKRIAGAVLAKLRKG